MAASGVLPESVVKQGRSVSIQKTIFALCARPTGATNADIRIACGGRSDSIRTQLALEVGRGKIFRCAPAAGSRITYYTDAAAAQAAERQRSSDVSESLRAAAQTRTDKIKAIAASKKAKAEHAEKVAKSRAVSQVWVSGGRVNTHKAGAPPPLLPGSDRFRNPARIEPVLSVERYTAGASKLALPIPGHVDASRAVVTIAKDCKHDPRYQIDPESFAGGEFSKAGIGRYLSTESMGAA